MRLLPPESLITDLDPMGMQTVVPQDHGLGIDYSKMMMIAPGQAIAIKDPYAGQIPMMEK